MEQQLVYGTYQLIYIITPPLIALHTLPIPGIRRIVGKILAFYRIRVEIVVEMNCIDVIAGHYIVYYGQNVCSRIGQPGVEIEFPVIPDKELWFSIIYMAIGQCLVGRQSNSIRIYPCVQLHVALVTLLYDKL